MINAKEWHSKFGASEEYTAMWDSHCIELIKQIQLDAYKDGLNKAIELCKESEDYACDMPFFLKRERDNTKIS